MDKVRVSEYLVTFFESLKGSIENDPFDYYTKRGLACVTLDILGSGRAYDDWDIQRKIDLILLMLKWKKLNDVEDSDIVHLVTIIRAYVQRKKELTPEPEKENKWIEVLKNGVSEGCRDDTAFRLAGYLKNLYPKETVLKLMQEWNLKNKPPLKKFIIEKKVEQAFNYLRGCV